MLEAMVHLNYNLIKQKGYDQKLTEWLSEYQKLKPEEQSALAEAQQKVQEVAKIIQECQPTKSTPKDTPESANISPLWLLTLLLPVGLWGWFNSKKN
jgi:hypothetical protein